MTRLALYAHVVAIAALPACTADYEIDLAEPTVSADVYDDGTQIRVLACNEAAAFGCNAETPGASVAMTVDGVTFDSRTTSTQAEPDELMSLFHAGSLRVAGPAPSDGIVDLAIAPSGYTKRIVLPPRPGIIDPGTVVRGQGPIAIQYDARPDAGMAIAIVTVDCAGTTGDAEVVREVTAPGLFEIDLAALTSSTATCAQSVQIDQMVPADGARIITIARTTFVSTP